MGKYEQNFKKFCKLENGTIQTCYYPSGEPKKIYKKEGSWYLAHDVYMHNMIFYLHQKIVAFADTVEELMK